MGTVIKFPVLNRKAEDQFITVLKNDTAHIMWNRSQLFYIRECKYPVSNRILCYVTVDSRGRASKIAKWIVDNILQEQKVVASYDKTENKP